ncbi:MAG: hypothetical protein O8C66_05410 [Candidatus Methanoperedens sp.]|nr:hypothetical protein [Candidatus Methanoperedens sp.]MCZ7369929.1 hypothetical protein [Candidatus Methanoperedens sp.]
MGDFLEKLQKIRSGFLSRMRFLFLLDLISVFSIFYAIFVIFQVEYFLNKSSFYLPIPVKFVPPILAFIIAIISALLMHKKDSKINVNLLIENKYSELKERLMTAYDNRNETNVIVDSLKDNVSDALTTVSSSHLLAKTTIISKILVTIIFIAGVAMISSNPGTYTIPPETIANNFKNITGADGTGNETVIIPVGPIQNLQNVGSQGSGDIIGKPKIASLEGKNIDLSLHAGIGTGFVPSVASQPQNQFIASAAYPVDVLGSNVSDGGYSILMQKTQAEKKLIQDYAVERSKI